MAPRLPKISIIIPVYNAEKYLVRCLESVCNQTLRELEIICVDDCSQDGSAEILQKYSRDYENLKFLSLEKNCGESFARNAGLGLARGEYLAFIDNDDEIDLNFFEKLYEKAHEKNADIVKGQVIEISYDGKEHVIKQMREDADKEMFLGHWWSAIYKRSLIVENDISFSIHHPLGGDRLFLNRAIVAAKNLQLVEGVYYRYCRREDSGDSKILSEEKIKSALDIYGIITDNTNLNISPSNSTYSFIFHHFIIDCFYLALRSEEENLRKLCAKSAANIFEKCKNKNALEIYFSNTIPHLFMFLHSGNQSALEDALIKYKSRAELIATGLRARIKK